MSEFKYACPVCGQHMMCDSSQSGTTMECPTCFQKIVAPQAPSTSDPKFIITGTKVGSERPIPAALANAAAAPAPAPEKSFPGLAIGFGVLFCIAAGVLFAFHGKIFKSSDSSYSPGTNNQRAGQTPSTRPPKPAAVAPPADDARWMLNLGAAVIPDSAAAGRIHGQDFICERTIFQNGTLTLRSGSRGSVELGVLIDFKGAPAESLSGQSLNVTTNADKAANVILRWQDGGEQQKTNFSDSYALRLDFGQPIGNRLPGKIYLCLPDEGKSYLAGAFIADLRKPRTPKR
jgi:DNA-directed RNA polymerase subunit RPC12/RpoP